MNGSRPVRVLLATTCTPDDRKTLCAARALGRAGFEVSLASDRFLGGACYSKYVRRRIRYASRDDDVHIDVSAIAASLAEELERDRYDVLLPMNDYTTLAVARHRDRLEPHTALVAPELESLLVTRDKLETLRLAGRLGIDTPATHCARDADELATISARLDYPCVMKPRKGAGGVGLVIAGSPRDLREAYAARASGRSDAVYDFGDMLVQERVPGEVHDVCMLLRRGALRAAMTQRRLLTYPRRGGVGILNETTHEPELVEKALALLGALGWHGPAQVEFKIDPESGKARLMEINGRFWGTLDLSVAAGVNFPLLVCRLALDGDVEPSLSYEAGLRYRWPAAYGLLATLESPDRWRTLRTLLAPERQSRSDLCLGDPLPHLAELVYVARRMYERRSFRPERTSVRRAAAPRAEATAGSEAGAAREEQP